MASGCHGLNGVIAVRAVMEGLDLGVDAVQSQNLVVNHARVMTLKLRNATPTIVLVSPATIVKYDFSLCVCDHI